MAYQPTQFKRKRDGRTKTAHSASDEVKLVHEGYARLGPAMTDEFDPAAYKVSDVLTYLESADTAEQARVMDAEEAGKGRVSILSWESFDES